jgi:hypothetical protein
MTHAVSQKHETRKLKEIVEIINVTAEGIAMTNTPFVWNPVEDKFYFKKNSKIFEKISKSYGITMDELQSEFRRRAQLLYKMYENKIFDFQKFQDMITQYYKKPKEILDKFGIE